MLVLTRMSLKMRVRARPTGYVLTSTLVENLDHRPGWLVQFAPRLQSFGDSRQGLNQEITNKQMLSAVITWFSATALSKFVTTSRFTIILDGPITAIPPRY